MRLAMIDETLTRKIVTRFFVNLLGHCTVSEKLTKSDVFMSVFHNVMGNISKLEIKQGRVCSSSS